MKYTSSKVILFTAAFGSFDRVSREGNELRGRPLDNTLTKKYDENFTSNFIVPVCHH